MIMYNFYEHKLKFSLGILIYVSLIHMMKEEMDREEYKNGGQIIYFLYSGFVLGVAAMAVIGIWA